MKDEAHHTAALVQLLNAEGSVAVDADIGQKVRLPPQVGLPNDADAEAVVVLLLDPRENVATRQNVLSRPEVVAQDDDALDERAAVGGLEVGPHALAPRLVLPVVLGPHPGDGL